METAEVLIQRASEARRQGRAAEAIEAYEALLRQRPDLPDSWYNLALMRRRVGRFQDALVAYGEALTRGVGGPEEVHLNRAVILSEDLGDTDGALEALSQALAIRPDYLPALMNLGNLHEDRGEREAAASAYRRVLERAPRDPVATARLAGVAGIARSDDPLLEDLRGALDKAAIPLADRATVGFALGAALDGLADYDAAFEAYVRANAASRACSGAPYDRAAHEAYVDRLIAVFDRPVACVEGDVAPVFVCGLFRSGSTLVERILAAHDRVTDGGELDLIPRLARESIRPYPEAMADADPAQIDAWRSAYLEGLKAARPTADIVTDKRPDNFLHIGLIKTLFPGARIVHTRRDPVDVCLSNWFLHLDPSMPQALDLEDMAHWHGQYERLMAHWKRLYPDTIRDVDYDALVREPRLHIERLLRFLDLDWQEGCLAFHETKGSVRTASVWQVREPLYRRSSGRWRNYERHLHHLRAALDGG